MHVERITSTEGFQELHGEWNALLARSRADCVFLTWEWLFTWWKHFEPGRELAILAVRDGTELVALAPFVLRRTRIVGLEFRSFAFLGHGTIGSDYLDVIVDDARRDEALRTLAAHLHASGTRLDLAQVARGDADARALAAELSTRGWRRVELRTEVCPFIRLRGHTWDSYVETLGRAHRGNLRRRLRQARAKFDVTFASAASDEERRSALETLIRLHLARWRDRGVSEAFATPALVAFHDEMTGLARERGWLRLYVLALDTVPVASLYGFSYRGVFSFYQSGFDPAFAKWSVGLITMGLAIEQAIAEGAEEYDLLHGDEPYKFLWAREQRALSRLELYPPSASDLAIAGARILTRTAKRGIRKLAPRPARGPADAVEQVEIG
ncbi:MAG: GNAT family N-acetyltransferase [Candidatus Rokubacteria bacterium]|nr:GNAT family N-acetyltransferase [Candidatus Rokubacteria bacterium]